MNSCISEKHNTQPPTYLPLRVRLQVEEEEMQNAIGSEKLRNDEEENKR